MECLSWKNAPGATRAQVKRLLFAFRRTLRGNLQGVYLHGSLATGCFHPTRSDVDLLVVVRRVLGPPTKRRLVEALLILSRAPHPVEISFLRQRALRFWRHPAAFELHYSEDWRQGYAAYLAADGGRWPVAAREDADLAAHVKVTKERGVVLWGASVAQALPDVPDADFLDAVVSDMAWARARVEEFPVYAVLNACRIYAYHLEGRLLSKAEGAVWGARNLPERFAPTVAAAHDAYRSPDPDPAVPDSGAARELVDYVTAAIAGRPGRRP